MVFHCVDKPHFGCFGYFHLSAVANSAAVNMGDKYLLVSLLPGLSGVYLEVELLDHMANKTF
jgi:hypothetical protein